MKIAIIGMTGTGKTAAGIALAERIGHSFADIDDIIVYKVGMPIEQVYIYFGEKVYRSYETSALLEVIWHDDIVISCGGGVTLNKENMELMKDFTKVWLTADAETIHARVKDLFKPKLRDNSVPALDKTLREREEHYRNYADITVDTAGKSIDEVAAKIEAELKAKGLL